jgi:hypothetical protein
MTTDRILQIRKSKEAAQKRQEANYYATGNGEYMKKARGYEDVVELCDQALSVSRDRDAAAVIKNALMSIAQDAKQAEKECRLGCCGSTPRVLRRIQNLAKEYGWRG